MIDEYEATVLTDYVFDTNLSPREIAKEMGRTELEIKKAIRELGIGWVRRKNGFASRGQAALTSIMKKLLPGTTIRTEEPIGERLRLDVYCPTFELAAEYSGRQHYYYVEFFHGDREGFYESQRRDERKAELCQELGITLVVFRYTDDLTEDTVYNRLYDALRSSPAAPKKQKTSIKGNPFYEAQKQRNREYNRMQYRRMKGKSAGGRRQSL